MVTDEDGVHEGVYDVLADGYNDPKWPFQYFDPIAWMPLPEEYRPE